MDAQTFYWGLVQSCSTLNFVPYYSRKVRLQKHKQSFFALNQNCLNQCHFCTLISALVRVFCVIFSFFNNFFCVEGLVMKIRTSYLFWQADRRTVMDTYRVASLLKLYKDYSGARCNYWQTDRRTAMDTYRAVSLKLYKN